jgi:hypothetical protein
LAAAGTRKLGGSRIDPGNSLPDHALALGDGYRWRAPVIALLFFGFVGYAKLSGHWRTRLPQQVYFELVPQASEVQHP